MVKTALVVDTEAMSIEQTRYWETLASKLDLKIVRNGTPDVLFFVDGPPIHPQMYGHKPLFGINYDEERDGLETYYFKTSGKTLKIGIGRGACLLNTMNYGKVCPKKHQLILPANGKLKTVDHRIWMEPRKPHLHHPRIVWYPETNSLCYNMDPELALLQFNYDKALKLLAGVVYR